MHSYLRLALRDVRAEANDDSDRNGRSDRARANSVRARHDWHRLSSYLLLEHLHIRLGQKSLDTLEGHENPAVRDGCV